MMQLPVQPVAPSPVGDLGADMGNGGDEHILMQTTWPSPKLVDDNFRFVLRNMQNALELVTEEVAGLRAQLFGRRLLAWRTGPTGLEGIVHDRVAQLGVVVAAFEPLPECDDQVRLEDAQWVQDWWTKLWPFLATRGVGQDVNQATGAASSGDRVVVVDSLTAEEDTQDNGQGNGTDVQMAQEERDRLSEEDQLDMEERRNRL